MSYYLIHTTYPILFLAVLARQLFLPVPAILFLLSGGALVGAGKLSYAGILLVAVLGCVLADLVWFEAGRISGKRVVRLLCALATDPSYCIRRGRMIFRKRGIRLLLIAKFVPGLDGISAPMAGTLGASRASFILHDMGGATLWAAAYITCGFFFAKQMDLLTRRVSVFANALVLALGVPLLLFLVWKLLLLSRMIRLLRPQHITPAELKSRLDAGEKLGVIDLLRFEDDPHGVPGIPGAVRLDPPEIRRKKHIVVPPDVGVVIYCHSKSIFVSARVAAAMRKHGILRVQVLEGGLNAWTSCGYPLSRTFADPEAELKRLGVEMSPPWRPLSAKRR